MSKVLCFTTTMMVLVVFYFAADHADAQTHGERRWFTVTEHRDLQSNIHSTHTKGCTRCSPGVITGHRYTYKFDIYRRRVLKKYNARWREWEDIRRKPWKFIRKGSSGPGDTMWGLCDNVPSCPNSTVTAFNRLLIYFVGGRHA